MCTGFTRDAHRYFMKASPVRPGDFIEFFAEIDLIGALSACPGGDCGSGHSSDAARCHPLKIEIFRPQSGSAARLAAAAGQRLRRGARSVIGLPIFRQRDCLRRSVFERGRAP